MAFTCEPCHKPPMRGWCRMLFDIGRGSFGPCENCGNSTITTDCRCDTLVAVKPDPVSGDHIIPPGAGTIRILPPDGFEFNGPGHIDPFGLRPKPVYVSEAENDEPGCNDCDGFVFVHDICPSCGLVGTQARCPRCGGTHDRIDSREPCPPAPPHDHARRDVTDFSATCARCTQEVALTGILIREIQDEEEPVKHRIDRSTLRGVETKGRTSIRQELWQRCPTCGKTGSHEHYSKPTAPSVAAEYTDPSGHRFADSGYLDAVINDVARKRRKMLLEDYDFGTAEMRILAKLMGVTDEQLDTLGMRVLEAFPGIKRFAAVYAVHGDLVFDVETEDGD